MNLRINFKIVILTAFIFLFTSNTGLFGISLKEAKLLIKARFISVSKIYAQKRNSLGVKERKIAEDILAIASRLSGKNEFKKADYLLDELKDMLMGNKSFFPDKNEKKIVSKIVTNKPVVSVTKTEILKSSYSLSDAFKSPEEVKQEKEEKASVTPVAPSVSPFKLERLSAENQKNFKILGSILPDVEETFKMHPNPETAQAMKDVRRFFYYLKKKGMGLTGDSDTDAELGLFMQEKIGK